MLSIIKTAIITIVISFISGVLLDTYKNLAPRIVCSVGKGISIVLKNKKIRAYALTVRNISNKTIHDLTLNVQGHYDNLKVDDAKITRGLKFDVSNEDNIYSVNIPFLSKDDEFSLKLFVERSEGGYKKPSVMLRSPENFKKIESEEQNGFMASLLSVPENIGSFFKRKISKDRELDNTNTESSFNNKKVVAAIASIILIIFIAVAGIEHYIDKNKGISNDIKTTSSQQINNSNNASNNASNNSKNKPSSDKTNNSSNNNTSNNNSPSKGTNNDASGEKSTTPSSNKNEKQPINEPKSKSEPSDSNSKSEETSSSDGETKNADNNSVDGVQGNGEKKDSGESKSEGNPETNPKTKEGQTNGSETGEDSSPNPSKSTTN